MARRLHVCLADLPRWKHWFKCRLFHFLVFFLFKPPWACPAPDDIQRTGSLPKSPSYYLYYTLGASFYRPSRSGFKSAQLLVEGGSAAAVDGSCCLGFMRSLTSPFPLPLR